MMQIKPQAPYGIFILCLSLVPSPGLRTLAAAAGRAARGVGKPQASFVLGLAGRAGPSRKAAPGKRCKTKNVTFCPGLMESSCVRAKAVLFVRAGPRCPRVPVTWGPEQRGVTRPGLCRAGAPLAGTRDPSCSAFRKESAGLSPASQNSGFLRTEAFCSLFSRASRLERVLRIKSCPPSLPRGALGFIRTYI